MAGARGVRADALLRAAVAVSRVLLEDPDLETAVPNALAVLGAGVGVDRAFLQRRDAGSHPAALVAEWRAPGAVADAGPAPPRVILLPVVDDDDRRWGELGLADGVAGRGWSDGAMDALRELAGTFGSALRRGALERARTEAAVREGVAAAEGRAAEQAHANRTLRQTAARLAAGLAGAADADAVLAVFLREVVAVAGAAAGAVLRRVAGTEFEFVALLDAGELVAGERLRGVPMAASMPEASRVDPSGCFERIVDGETTLWTLHLLDLWHPEYVAYWRARGVEAVWHVPFTLRGEVVGHLALAFSDAGGPRGVVPETVAALASQIGLALELTRLVEEAKVGVVNAERDRMAREIHDTLAQGFAGVLMQLQSMTRETPDLPAAAVDRLNAVMALARENLIEARQAFRRLRTRTRGRAAFANALEQLVATARRASPVPITAAVDRSVDWLPGEVETELLRIAQEALTNALTHGQARTISLEMTGVGSGVRVIVQDDGRGFDPDTRADGFGLTTMSERAAHIGASLTVASAPGEGTEVITAWPVEDTPRGPRQPTA